MSKKDPTLYEQFSRPTGPAFSVGDIVHILDEPVKQPPASVSDPAPATISTDGPTTTLNAGPARVAALGPTTVSTPASTSVNEFVRETTWEITAVDDGTASGRTEYTYQLQPTEAMQIIMPESRLLATEWLPEDLVKDSTGALYKVEEVKFHRLANGGIGRKYVVTSEAGNEKEFGEEDLEDADPKEWFPIGKRANGRDRRALWAVLGWKSYQVIKDT
jgi:hypothetical protein